MPSPDHQIAREESAAAKADASAVLVALARLLGRMAAREHLAASDRTTGETSDAAQDHDHVHDAQEGG